MRNAKLFLTEMCLSVAIAIGSSVRSIPLAIIMGICIIVAVETLASVKGGK